MHLLVVSLFLLLVLSLHLAPLSHAQLSPSFYATSCPNAVPTVTNTIVSLSKKDNVVPPSILRLVLHDCFVEGCDASILLDSTSGNKAERDAPDNVNLPQNAFNAIVEAKKAVEAICPGVVSCADILVLAARDVVVLLGGPTWDVPLGRLDGRVSTASSVAGRIPGANFNVKQLSDNFGSVGLSLQDMVILSGAHTIGFSHCDQFKNRLYDFNSSVKVDPSMDAGFVDQLQQKCPAGGGQDNLQAFDILTPFGFDNNYYKDLQSGKGLLFSDQVLFQDPSTQATVVSLAASQDQFYKSFMGSMIKMTSVGVKQGNQGEIRRDCTVVNPNNGFNPGTDPTPTPTPTSPPPPPPPPPPNPTPVTVNPPVPILVPPTPPEFNPLPTPVAFNPPLTPVAFNPPQTPVSPPIAFNAPLTPFAPLTPVALPTPVALNPPPGFTVPGLFITPPIPIPFPGFDGGPPPPLGGNPSPASNSPPTPHPGSHSSKRM